MSFADELGLHADDCRDFAFDRVVTLTTRTAGALTAGTGVRDAMTATQPNLKAGREMVTDDPTGGGEARRRARMTAFIFHADDVELEIEPGRTTITDAGVVWSVVSIAEHGGGELVRVGCRDSG